MGGKAWRGINLSQDPVKRRQAVLLYYRGQLDAEIESLRKMGLSEEEIRNL
jgi:hypothetical protein